MPTAFFSERLDEICCGTVELSVPLRRDIIQIGAAGDVEVGRIRVRKGARTITVIRVDGKPMQVDIVTNGPATSRVFDVPVRVLTLVRADCAGPGRWHPVGRSAGAAHPQAVKQFADVIGTFAAAKQQRVQHSQRG